MSLHHPIAIAASALVLGAASIACTGQVDGGNGGAAASAGAGTGIDVNGDGKIDGIDVDGDGDIDQPPGAGGSGGGTGLQPDDVVKACEAQNGMLNAGLTRLRRLTRDQFDNTVRDLLGIDARSSDALAPDERIGPFHSNAIAPITDLLVEQHQEVAAELATQAEARMAALSPCDLAADTGTTCATRFVSEFGLRAYRRPLLPEEVTAHVALYSLGRNGSTAANGFRLVVEAMLQSPFFLYHHDVGPGGTPQAATVPLTPYEFASRLSYFLWNSMPDAELFSAAASGSLGDDAAVDAQVTRMLNDARAAGTIALFHRQWLALEELPAREKDTTLFPSYDPALAEAMLAEMATFTDSVIRRGDGLLRTLLTSNVAYPSGQLFSIYGVAQPAGFTAGSPVTLNPAERAGLLTQAAFLTRHAHRDQTSPVHRGIVVRENMMCQVIPPPPANVNNVPPPPNAATSTRERFAQHSADPACEGCHRMMDPIGLGFEHYDAIGRYRTMDGMGTVDASGEIHGATGAAAGPFVGAIELSSKLAESESVSDCVTQQWFRFSLGRMESADDACSILSIRDAFRSSGGNVRGLLAEVARSAAFRHVRTNGG